MGGTFMSLPLNYRDRFVSALHDALSGHVSSSVQEAVKYACVCFAGLNSSTGIYACVNSRSSFCFYPLACFHPSFLRLPQSYYSFCSSLFIPSCHSVLLFNGFFGFCLLASVSTRTSINSICMHPCNVQIFRTVCE